MTRLTGLPTVSLVLTDSPSLCRPSSRRLSVDWPLAHPLSLSLSLTLPPSVALALAGLSGHSLSLSCPSSRRSLCRSRSPSLSPVSLLLAQSPSFWSGLTKVVGWEPGPTQNPGLSLSQCRSVYPSPVSLSLSVRLPLSDVVQQRWCWADAPPTQVSQPIDPASVYLSISIWLGSIWGHDFNCMYFPTILMSTACWEN